MTQKALADPPRGEMKVTEVTFTLLGGDRVSSRFNGNIEVYFTPDCVLSVKAGYLIDALGPHNKFPDGLFLKVNGERVLVKSVIHVGTELL